MQLFTHLFGGLSLIVPVVGLASAQGKVDLSGRRNVARGRDLIVHRNRLDGNRAARGTRIHRTTESGLGSPEVTPQSSP
jgi:hypothetical protein